MKTANLLKLLVILLFVPFFAVSAEEMAEVPLTDLLTKGLMIATTAAVKWQLTLAAILSLLIGTTKNSFLRKYLWDKLGAAKVLVAPVLSVIVVLIAVQPFTWGSLVFALTTGMGAIAINEMLKAIKALPFVGPKYDKMLDAAAILLRKPK